MIFFPLHTHDRKIVIGFVLMSVEALTRVNLVLSPIINDKDGTAKNKTLS